MERQVLPTRLLAQVAELGNRSATDDCSRFGRAVRLQEKGRLHEAKQAFRDLDAWFDQNQQVVSPPPASVRLMVLIHLAQATQASKGGAADGAADM